MCVHESMCVCVCVCMRVCVCVVSETYILLFDGIHLNRNDCCYCTTYMTSEKASHFAVYITQRTTFNLITQNFILLKPVNVMRELLSLTQAFIPHTGLSPSHRYYPSHRPFSLTHVFIPHTGPLSLTQVFLPHTGLSPSHRSFSLRQVLLPHAGLSPSDRYYPSHRSFSLTQVFLPKLL